MGLFDKGKARRLILHGQSKTTRLRLIHVPHSKGEKWL
jgi:hypothetical protein